jgi:UTP--glucose-1-phosphate uridylyltransferase
MPPTADTRGRPGVRAGRALIPAAGRGTRFLPVTKSVPKELLPIVSTPAVEFVVSEAARNGIEDIVLVLSKDKQAIADYFARDPELEAVLAVKGDESGLEAVRRPSTLARIHQTEQPQPRGLGDAVAQGELFCAGEPFAVLLPDDLIDDRDELLGRMLDVQADHGGVVLGLMPVHGDDISKYGCVAISGAYDKDIVGSADGDVVAVTDLVEKPSLADAPSDLAIIGRYVLPPAIFDALRATAPGAGGEIQLTDAMRRLVHDGVPVHGVVFSGRRYDTGDRLDYLRAVVQLTVQQPGIGAEFDGWLREFVDRSSSR